MSQKDGPRLAKAILEWHRIHPSLRIHLMKCIERLDDSSHPSLPHAKAALIGLAESIRSWSGEMPTDKEC